MWSRDHTIASTLHDLTSSCPRPIPIDAIPGLTGSNSFPFPDIIPGRYPCSFAGISRT